MRNFRLGPGLPVSARPGVCRQIFFAHFKVEVSAKAVVGAFTHCANHLPAVNQIACGNIPPV